MNARYELAGDLARQAALTRKTERVLDNARLRRRQHINAAAATLAGFSGLAAAIAFGVLVRPPSATTLAIFLAFFLPIELGVTVGLHRHFTHRSFEAGRGTRATLAILGCMAGQGPVVFWVALHRLHHEFSDREGDPHSPNLAGRSLRGRIAGLLHAYLGWTVRHEVPNARFYAPGLLKDPLIAWIDARYYLWVALGLAAPTLAGALLLGGWLGAAEGLIWGGLLRMCAGHHAIWCITSLAHVVGHRSFDSKDHSTNNFWLALPTLGESWHNNHHAFPSAPALDFHWWQIDISGATIRLLARLGLARNLRMPSPSVLQARARAAAPRAQSGPEHDATKGEPRS